MFKIATLILGIALKVQAGTLVEGKSNGYCTFEGELELLKEKADANAQRACQLLSAERVSEYTVIRKFEGWTGHYCKVSARYACVEL